MNLEFEGVVAPRVQNQLAHDAELLRELRRDEQIELAETESVGRAPLVGGATIHVGEALNLEARAARAGLVFVLAENRSRLLRLLRGGFGCCRRRRRSSSSSSGVGGSAVG